MSETNVDNQKQQYDAIMQLYGYADELIETAGSDFVDSASAQLALVEPLVVQIEESADILTDEYISLAEGKSKRSSRGKIEKALRKVYTAMDDYTLKLHGTLKTKTNSFVNIADAIILKVKEKLENIIVVFLSFVSLSLDRVMHKNELDEIKRNQEHVFFQLHNLSQQH